MSKLKNIHIGADPEVFLRDKATGLFVSAIGLIGGSKDAPKRVTNSGHAVQEDNVMVEFNIPPCIMRKLFVHELNFMLDHIQGIIPQNLEIVVSPSAIMPEDQLKDPAALVFGCDPDFNAYLKAENPKPESKNPLLRTAGGHIHVGYDNPDIDISIELIRRMDLYLGVPSIVMDTDTLRREVYGKAGAFRIKEYGVEYRTLSNFWLQNDDFIEWAFDNTHAAIQSMNSGEEISDSDYTLIQQCINEHDTMLVEYLTEKYNINMINEQVLA